ncbi:unnamed protein product [Schistocephalus solidus]|uniref:Pescadillo homolog n=1 Tax=Schistocephalus solidus TaxID=70667 RepID=A0A183SIR4_SCHSO|nr:unnamed protein product [Schistocephalus solidus]
MRRLQLGLSNFRRLCILKGVYPVEPKNKKKAGRGNSEPRIYFHAKDIAFLAREPLIETFRALRIHQRRLKRAREKLDRDKEFRLRMKKPTYTLHQLVKERYPTRRDALRDLSDSLNLLFLFSRLPRLPQFHPALISLCRRFCVEFLHYVIATRAVRKAFISIKGFYVEAVIDEVSVVWVIPHQSATHTPTDVDYRLLATCVEFDATLLGSLLCNLYKHSGLLYPPRLMTPAVPDPESAFCSLSDTQFEFLSSLSFPLKRLEDITQESACLDDLVELQTIDDSVTAAVNKQAQTERIKHLFENKRFFLNREVPKEVLTLLIRSCGGECSWDVSSGPGSTFLEDDVRINYQVVDRPMKEMSANRSYVQPQWVFDSLNAGRLLPAQDYLPSATLPPHLSPFAHLAVDPRAGLADAIKQAATVAPAPGFGTGSAMYRPPEADYLAGLVSLAEIRGAAVSASQNNSGGNVEGQEEEQKITGMDVEGNTPAKKAKKRKRMSAQQALAKGKKAVVTPGRTESTLSLKMAAKAEENAQRKLRELMLPKRHKNLYRKMVHAQKTANKDVATS